MDNQALVTHLLTADKPFDLLVLNTKEYDAQQLMKKGYLVDLSASDALRAYADDALETFQRIIRDDTGLYALPLNIQTHAVSANLPLLEELGQPLPRSFPQLMDLLNGWGEEGHTLKEDTALLDAAHAKRVLKDLAFRSYVDSMIGRGETLSFDMDTFGAMMQDIDRLDVTAWDLPPTYGSGEDDDLYIPNILLNPSVGYLLDGYREPNHAYLLFSPDGVHPGYGAAHGQVIAASAQGTQQDTALRFLEAYVRNLSDISRAAVNQRWSTPIENPRYQQEYDDQQAYLAQYRARYEAAEEGAAKRQYAEDVAYFEKKLATFEKDRKYLADAAQLKEYQDFMAHVYVDDGLSQLQQKALSTDGYLFGMYTEGALTLEQFIEQANDKIRLMLMEAQ